MQLPEVLNFDNDYLITITILYFNYFYYRAVTGKYNSSIKSKINCNDFKYSVRSSNTVVPSPSTQSAENNALSSSKNITI